MDAIGIWSLWPLKLKEDLFILQEAEAILADIPIGVMCQRHVRVHRQNIVTRLLQSCRHNDDTCRYWPVCLAKGQEDYVGEM